MRLSPAREKRRREFAAQSQEFIDTACIAVAWALLEPDANCRLSQMAVEETGLGNAAATRSKKIAAKRWVCCATFADKKPSVLCAKMRRAGITEIARPCGIVAALTPSTNPLATPINKTINALKGGNAIILAPPPKGAKVGAALLARIHAELTKIGAPANLVQMLLPPSKEATARLMQCADLVVVTGSQRNVRAAYSSGTPAIGVGAGNVAVIVDETADIADAAAKVCAFQNF